METVRLQAGKLRHTVSIQSASEAADAMGTLVPSWSTDATVRASITQVSGDESVTAGQEQATAKYKVVIRYYSGLTTANRLLFGSRELNIDSISDIDERNRKMELMCSEDV